MATITMDSTRPTVVGNVIMISGDVNTSGFGVNTFDASPYMNEIINVHALSEGQLVDGEFNAPAPKISKHGTAATGGFILNLPALSCTFSGTTVTFTTRTVSDGIINEGQPDFLMNAQAAAVMQESATLGGSLGAPNQGGKFLIIGRK